MYQALTKKLCAALGLSDHVPIKFWPTKPHQQGDIATNAAFVILNASKKPMSEKLDFLHEYFDQQEDIQCVTISGIGFINLTMRPTFWIHQLQHLLKNEILTPPSSSRQDFYSSITSSKNIEHPYKEFSPKSTYKNTLFLVQHTLVCLRSIEDYAYKYFPKIYRLSFQDIDLSSLNDPQTLPVLKKLIQYPHDIKKLSLTFQHYPRRDSLHLGWVDPNSESRTLVALALLKGIGMSLRQNLHTLHIQPLQEM